MLCAACVAAVVFFHGPAVAQAEKQGFSAPDASWFKGESINYLQRVVFNDRAKIFDFLDQKAVRALVSEHIDAKANRRLLIWSLLYMENWCQQFMN